MVTLILPHRVPFADLCGYEVLLIAGGIEGCAMLTKRLGVGHAGSHGIQARPSLFEVPVNSHGSWPLLSVNLVVNSIRRQGGQGEKVGEKVLP